MLPAVLALSEPNALRDRFTDLAGRRGGVLSRLRRRTKVA
jgi:hypothetical protein